MSWAALPATVRVWAGLIGAGWVIEAVAQQTLPPLTGLLVPALAWYGVARGIRWVWIAIVVLMSLGVLMAGVGLVVAPEVLDGVPAWAAVLGVALLIGQFGCLLAPATREHVGRGSDRGAGPGSGGPGPGGGFGGDGGPDDGARWRQGLP